MPRFDRRDHTPEMMDDLSITDERLTRALEELRLVNLWLGGHRASLQALAPLMLRAPARRWRVLDVATGGADFAEALLPWADREGVDVEVTGIDLNPATLAYAEKALDRRLSPRLRERVTLRTGDALDLPFEDGHFDVAHAALFLHHLGDEEAVRCLREMSRVARATVINDLHRHPVAYHSIGLIGRLFSTSPMFRQDAPRSVLRAFTRPELESLARAAGLEAQIAWRWAFRWVMTAPET